MLDPFLKKEHTRLRQQVPVEKHVVIALWRLAKSIEYRTLGHLFGIGRSTACKITSQFCEAVVKHLMPLYIKFPHGEDFREVVNGFPSGWWGYRRFTHTHCCSSRASHRLHQPKRMAFCDYARCRGSQVHVYGRVSRLSVNIIDAIEVRTGCTNMYTGNFIIIELSYETFSLTLNVLEYACDNTILVAMALNVLGYDLMKDISSKLDPSVLLGFWRKCSMTTIFYLLMQYLY